MREGDIVKVIQSSDDSNPALFIGEIGRVMKTMDGDSVSTMIPVKFDNGEMSSYWAEELKLI